jgi:DNA polymerase-3 subunit beta
VDRDAISKALKRVSVVTSGQSRGVKIAVSPKNMEVSSSNPDFGEAHEELSVQYRGDSFEVGFNAKYFLDVLSVLEDDEAVLKMGDDTSPCLIKSETDPGFTHIIMPMRL